MSNEETHIQECYDCASVYDFTKKMTRNEAQWHEALNAEEGEGFAHYAWFCLHCGELNSYILTTKEAEKNELED